MKKLFSLLLLLTFFSFSFVKSQDLVVAKKVDKQSAVVKQQGQQFDLGVLYCYQFSETGFESPKASIGNNYTRKTSATGKPGKTVRPHEDPGRCSLS